MKIKNVKATGAHVVLKVVPIEKEVEETLDGGLILTKTSKEGSIINVPEENGEKIRGKMIVYSIGPEVDLEKCGFKIGDEVFYNPYDAQTMGDDEQTFVLIKAVNIRAVVEGEE